MRPSFTGSLSRSEESLGVDVLRVQIQSRFRRVPDKDPVPFSDGLLGLVEQPVNLTLNTLASHGAAIMLRGERGCQSG